MESKDELTMRVSGNASLDVLMEMLAVTVIVGT